MDICNEFLPRQELRAFVECIWYSPAVSETRFDIVPDGCVDACFVLSERRPETLLFGTTTRTSAYEMERAPYFGVRFRPGQAAGFVREKIADLTDAVHSVPDFLDLRAEQMIDAGTMVERRFLIESALMKALTGVTDRLMPALVGALAMIDTRHGNIRVRKLASMCNVSERQLERLFLERVGIAPKLYMRIRRFRSVLNYFEDPPDTTRTSFAETAAAFGYVDQSHLARDFRDFAYQLSA